MTAVHQFLPTFAGRDAIGMHVLRLQRLLRDAGFDSDIYATHRHDEVMQAGYDFGEFRHRNPRPTETWGLYHYSIGSPMIEELRIRGVQLALDYHNVTEARFFLRWDASAAITMFDGRRQLASLRDAVRFSLADSSFNEAELTGLGFTNTAVAPILIDFADFEGDADLRLMEQREARRSTGGAEWLAVGRIAPNKCLHDVVAGFAVYRRCIDPNAHLTLVGGYTAPAYGQALNAQCAALGLTNAVTLTDVVTHEQLLACYRTADVFVIMSEHEGFSVPVLEAMHAGVPVVAYGCCALPETVGDGGLLLERKDPVVLATAVHEVLNSRELREALVAAGHRRVEHFSLANTGPRVLATLKELMA